MTDRSVLPRRALLTQGGRLGLGLAVLPLLGACVGLPQVRQDADRFSLTPSPGVPADTPSSLWQLVVARPSASDALDSTRIAFRDGAFRISHVAGAAWASRLPDQVRALIVASFENSGRIVGVAPDTGGFRGDFVLASDIRAFEAVTAAAGQPPTVSLSLSARLIALPTRAIVASRRFDQERRAAGTDQGALIAAFDQASQALLTDLVVWALIEGNRAQRAGL